VSHAGVSATEPEPEPEPEHEPPTDTFLAACVHFDLDDSHKTRQVAGEALRRRATQEHRPHLEHLMKCRQEYGLPRLPALDQIPDVAAYTTARRHREPLDDSVVLRLLPWQACGNNDCDNGRIYPKNKNGELTDGGQCPCVAKHTRIRMEMKK
jgi:hypothetical protein